MMKLRKELCSFRHLLVLSAFFLCCVYFRKQLIYSAPCRIIGVKHDSYCIFQDYLRPDNNINGNLTLVTHTSIHFLYYVLEHADYWNGPISVSLFLENMDDEQTLSSLRLANTLVSSFPKVRSKVSIHLVLGSKSVEHCQLNVKVFSNLPYKELANRNITSIFSNYPRLLSLYPINVMRNLARNASKTPFILSIDIENIVRPTNCVELVSPLLDEELAENLTNVLLIRRFDIDESLPSLPKDKEELHGLIKEDKANEFRKFVFAKGHSVPDLESWLLLPKNNGTSFVTKRLPYVVHNWEPLVIFRNSSAPFHEENYPYRIHDNEHWINHLCHMDFTFSVVSELFTVHRGIKRNSSMAEVEIRQNYGPLGDTVDRDFQKRLNRLYPNASKRCQ